MTNDTNVAGQLYILQPFTFHTLQNSHHIARHPFGFFLFNYLAMLSNLRELYFFCTLCAWDRAAPAFLFPFHRRLTPSRCRPASLLLLNCVHYCYQPSAAALSQQWVPEQMWTSKDKIMSTVALIVQKCLWVVGCSYMQKCWIEGWRFFSQHLNEFTALLWLAYFIGQKRQENKKITILCISCRKMF